MVIINANLGTPYESIIDKIIKKGYAGNQTEVIRQALMAYNRQLEEEELKLVHAGVEEDMAEYDRCKEKGITLSELKNKYKK